MKVWVCKECSVVNKESNVVCIICGAPAPSPDNFIQKKTYRICPQCKTIQERSKCGECKTKTVLSSEGDLVEKYKADQCGNCHSYLQDGDNYCRVCGTKRGEGKFLPYLNIMQCIYGPMPENRLHQCKKCGYSWEIALMIDNQQYCPMCGKKVKVSILPTEFNEKKNNGFFIPDDLE